MEEELPNPLAPVPQQKQGISTSTNKDQSTNKYTSSPQATHQSRTDHRGIIGDEESPIPGASLTPRICDLSREEETTTLTSRNGTRSSDEALVSDRSFCTDLQPESYELLDISDLEGDIESFTHFSDGEEGTTDDVGEVKGRDEGRAVGQPPLKQATLAEWSRGELLRDSSDRPVEVSHKAIESI